MAFSCVVNAESLKRTCDPECSISSHTSGRSVLTAVRTCRFETRPGGSGCSRCSHLFGEDQAALFQIPDMAGEAFDLREVVRREKDGGFSNTVQQALNQLVADQGIEP